MHGPWNTQTGIFVILCQEKRKTNKARVYSHFESRVRLRGRSYVNLIQHIALSLAVITVSLILRKRNAALTVLLRRIAKRTSPETRLSFACVVA